MWPLGPTVPVCTGQTSPGYDPPWGTMPWTSWWPTSWNTGMLTERNCTRLGLWGVPERKQPAESNSVSSMLSKTFGGGWVGSHHPPLPREGASTPSAVDPSFIFSTVSIILSIESCRFGAGPSRSTTCLPCKKCVAALSVSSTISVTISQSWESKVPVETFSSFKTASTWWKESKLPEASVVGASTGIGPWVSSGMMRSKLTDAPDMAVARIEGVERKTFNFSHLRDKSSWAKMAVPFWLWMFAHIILASASTASSKIIYDMHFLDANRYWIFPAPARHRRGLGGSPPTCTSIVDPPKHHPKKGSKVLADRSSCCLATHVHLRFLLLLRNSSSNHACTCPDLCEGSCLFASIRSASVPTFCDSKASCLVKHLIKHLI